MPYIDLEYAKRLLDESGAMLERDEAPSAPPRLASDAECNEKSSPLGVRSCSRPQRKPLDEAVFHREPVCAQYSGEQSRAFEKVKRLALARERGTRELIERLVREGFSREDADGAVQRAVRCGLVDDVRYGAVLVRTRVSQGRGRYGIEQELERAGIVATDIPGWPDEFFLRSDFDPFRECDDSCDGAMQGGFGGAGSDGPEIERALSLLRRKPPRAKNVQASAYRKLVSKGYSSAVAQAATRRYLEEN